VEEANALQAKLATIEEWPGGCCSPHRRVYSTREMRIENVVNDVASIIRQALH
jgi:hypothetical protein